MKDETEDLRRARVDEVNSEAGDRATLEAKYGRVWDTAQLEQEFEVRGFLAPFVVVRRKSDGVAGSLEFRHSPRFYFNYKSD